jgi:hypothetical protein
MNFIKENINTMVMTVMYVVMIGSAAVVMGQALVA